MTQDVVKILEKKIKRHAVDHYEIYLQERGVFHAESREEKIFGLQEAFEMGVALRVFREKRCGFAHGNGTDEASLERLVTLACQNLESTDPDPDLSCSFLPSQSLKKVSVPFDKHLSRISSEEKFGLARSLEREAHRTDKRIVRVRGARYEDETRRVVLKNSVGFVGEYQTTLCDLSLMAVAEENGVQESGWESDFSPYFRELNPAKVGEGAAKRALSLLGARPIKTQTTPAFLDPVVGASLVGVLAFSFLGDQVRKERSALKGRLGESLYAPLLTLIDDPNHPKGFVQAPFDAEGTPARRTEVVRRGVLKNFLYDLPTAKKEGCETTGNAIRLGYKEPPRVGVTNFFVEPGEKKGEELLAEMESGFWITDLIGVHTADPVTGDFSLGASGGWVEKGKRSFPVRGVAVSGNLHDLFRRVVGVGSEIRFFSNYGCPPLLISSIDVGGS